ncbi:MFS transporter [Halapricum hydrolyticum]|uniref:MFS transporter n=1 Tax=Halapricum hydrolyticum TaxID=2979991 RepID=A0AAE3LF67_9EURY|nr:MFS transporter [Halapricum hydrolyticum]MCU4717841.1 MFS transporter [Halapricum hydrolyticum]MCU4727005.1 MFS transporter [Halapricum hydrolyticum]
MTDRWLYPWGLGSVAFGGASLLVPLYAVQLGASAFQLGLLASAAAVAGAPGAIVFGRLADHVSFRRPLVIGTLATVAACLAVIPFVSAVTVVIAANAVLWLVIAAVAPVVTMIVVDAAPESTWAERIGRLNTFQGYGWAGGLLIGAVWPLAVGRFVGAGTATRTLFWAFAACGVFSAAGTAWALPKPDEHVTNPRRLRRISRILATSSRSIRGTTVVFSPNRIYWSTRALRPGQLRGRANPALVTYLVAVCLFLSGSAAFWAPLPLALTDAGIGSGTVFALYLLASLGSAALYGPAGRLASRYDLRRLQAGALAVRGISLPVVALAAGIGAVSLRFGFVGLWLLIVGATWGVMAVVGTAIVTRLAPPGIRGEVLGIHAALGAAAGGVGGILGGWVATIGYLAAFALAGALVLLGAALVISLRIVSGHSLSEESPSRP